MNDIELNAGFEFENCSLLLKMKKSSLSKYILSIALKIYMFTDAKNK